MFPDAKIDLMILENVSDFKGMYYGGLKQHTNLTWIFYFYLLG